MDAPITPPERIQHIHARLFEIARVTRGQGEAERSKGWNQPLTFRQASPSTPRSTPPPMSWWRWSGNNGFRLNLEGEKQHGKPKRRAFDFQKTMRL
jgi:hypothetical protein